ncbi:allophanate hydrolase subunit 1 [Amylibacter sp. SFDW26]|uniref:5-oxoprolinase subunit B family protein n=1 Tax=Amylibacter sp. SFDW26 TaxID=2652722 RepID=UPI001262816A|nr:allophanate hydrolase subunit 1 [Amylibacter sp. SFDW26]KAB7616135.1 allophanate hydrolase subunit 1 [Amylibacter sp. SFDW26]
MEPRFKPVADYALLISFATEIGDAANQMVVAFDRAVMQAKLKGVCETVPAFVNILIRFDPLITDHQELECALRKLMETVQVGDVSAGRKTVHVCYDDAFGPDLTEVAKTCGLTKEAVINAHLAGEYHIVMYGFAPGYAYMAGVPDAIQVPRKPTPVRNVAAGSVIIASAQCLVSTIVMPTGWSIIGRSPTKILLNEPDAPFLFDVGDRVTFKRIDLATYEQMSKGVKNG